MKSKPQQIGSELTNTTNKSHEVLQQVLMGLHHLDKQDCFFITVDGKEYKARLL